VKREVKAALALAALFAGILVFLWAKGREEAAPRPTPGARGVDPATSRAEVEPPTSEAAPLPAAPRAPRRSAPSASPEPTGRSAAPSAPAPSPTRTRPASRARLAGIVIAPNGSPVATKIYAFEVGPRVNPTYSYFGRQTPTEVLALARHLSKDRGNLLASTSSDSAGRFSFKRQELARSEVMLVAASKEGVGALRLEPGTPDPVLALEARRALQVQVLSSSDLGQARLELDLGRAGALKFPPLDPRGATRLEVPSALPAQTRLRLQRPNWLPLTRALTSTDLEGGRVTWTLPRDLVALQGQVQDPAGEPWAEEPVQFMFLPPGGERWRHLRVTTDSGGAFLGRGFPAGQPVLVRIMGGPHHAYHQVTVEGGGPPLAIQLRKPSSLRIRVERFEGDVDALETEWKLERLEAQGWQEVDGQLFGRPPSGFTDPDATESLERNFGLRVGSTEIRGLPPGKYRVSLAEFVDTKAEPVVVVLPPGGAASCELGVKPKPETTFRILLASPGAELGGKRVRVTYSDGAAEVLRTPTLDARGALTLRVKFTRPIPAEISVPELGLGAKVTLDPKAPDLGTVILQDD